MTRTSFRSAFESSVYGLLCSALPVQSWLHWDVKRDRLVSELIGEEVLRDFEGRLRSKAAPRRHPTLS